MESADNISKPSPILLSQESVSHSTPSKKCTTSNPTNCQSGFTVSEAYEVFGEMSPNSSSQFVTYAALQESKKHYDATNATHSPSYTKLIERQRFLDTKMNDYDPVEKKGCKL